jgi:hypothetical protein
MLHPAKKHGGQQDAKTGRQMDDGQNGVLKRTSLLCPHSKQFDALMIIDPPLLANPFIFEQLGYSGTRVGTDRGVIPLQLFVSSRQAHLHIHLDGMPIIQRYSKSTWMLERAALSYFPT